MALNLAIQNGFQRTIQQHTYYPFSMVAVDRYQGCYEVLGTLSILFLQRYH